MTEKYYFWNLIKEQIDNLSSPMYMKEMELVVRNIQ